MDLRTLFKGLNMSINFDLLIAAPMLQDFIIDKNATPLANGVITCYQDDSRTTLKNWYYQSSNFADAEGNYSFSKLPNPLTLSAAGTICDINGNDTIPFFYPYSELDENVSQAYYITVVNSSGTLQFTRPNFPYNRAPSNVFTDDSVDNYIINNVFWRNIGTATLIDVTQMTVAPSQHDGFRYPDIQFLKNITGGQDVVTFTKFLPTVTPALTGDITPEYYINHTCSNSQSGETQKCYQFPISLHLATLSSVPYTVTIQAQNVGETTMGADQIGLYIFQDTGTGTTAPNPVIIAQTFITLNEAWTKFVFSDIFPSNDDLTIGVGGDDALYLQVQMPLSTPCSINFTKPSIYLNNAIPTNDFSTYDQIDTVINSPRTGDIRTSINNFYYFGWVPMNDGTIGNKTNSTSSNATARANQDTWQLFNLLWTLCAPFSAPDSGTTNPLCQMYNSSGTPVGYGPNISVPTTAISDFTANNQLSLSSMLGRVIMGTVPLAAAIAGTITKTVTFTSLNGLNVSTSVGTYLYIGQPVSFVATSGTLPSTIAPNTIYYICNLTVSGGALFNLATTYAAAIAGTPTIPFASSSGTFQMNTNIPASTSGEYFHTQLTNEVGTHVHIPSVSGTGFVCDTSTTGTLAATGGGGQWRIFNTTGDVSRIAPLSTQIPFNIVQPATFYNIFIKL